MTVGSSTELLRALEAARMGYPVLPCDAYRQPLVPISDASTDPDQIDKWWKQFPNAIAGFLPRKSRIAASSFEWTDPARIPERQFLYGTHLIRGTGSATIAPPGVGKSSLALTEAIAMASNKNLLGVVSQRRCRVWYWNGEDPKEELNRRIAAICIHYGIGRGDLDGWLFVDSGRDQEIIIGRQDRTGAAIDDSVVNALIETIEDNKIDVVIIDPFISSHRVTENDNNAIDLVAKKWMEIANKTGTAIELVHHSKKTNGAEVTVEDGRGASALLAAVRSARVLNVMTAAEGKNAGVTEHRTYFREENGKANLAPPRSKATWYHLQSVFLRNGNPFDFNVGVSQFGDSVGVVGKWEWPDHSTSVTDDDFERAAVEIKAGRWRENQQAKRWVGHPVAKALGLDLAKKPDWAKVAGIIRVWIGQGKLVVVDDIDEKRELKKFVKVAE